MGIGRPNSTFSLVPDRLLALSHVPLHVEPRNDLLRVVTLVVLDEVEQMLRVRRDAERGQLVEARLATPIFVEAGLHLRLASFFVRDKLRIVQPFRTLHKLLLLSSELVIAPNSRVPVSREDGQKFELVRIKFIFLAALNEVKMRVLFLQSTDIMRFRPEDVCRKVFPIEQLLAAFTLVLTTALDTFLHRRWRIAALVGG